jgi:hypothetical protein
LSLYVRHSAWLSATPERPEGNKSTAPLQSRVQALRDARKDDDYEPEMPPLDRCGYLVRYLFEIGPVLQGAAGPVQLTNQEIAAWQELTATRLQPWEARFLRKLSREYANESHLGERRDRPAPWEEQKTVELIITAKILRDSFWEMTKPA